MGSRIKNIAFRSAAIGASSAVMIWLLWNYALPVTLSSAAVVLALHLESHRKN